MNLKAYYQKLRDVESRIEEEDPIVASLETPDGGRTGMLTETSRRIAARMIVDGKARLASEEESKGYREKVAAARRQAEQMATASRIQVTLVSEADGHKPGETAKRQRP